MKETIQKFIQKLKRNVKKLYIALHDDKTPIYAKIWGYVVIIYALSPIDLIPDFIPILGYLDDLILLPLGLWIFIHLIKQEQWNHIDEMVEEYNVPLIKHWYYSIPIILIWGLILYGLWGLVF